MALSIPLGPPNFGRFNVNTALQSNTSKGDAGHLEVMRAYEYVLDRLGQDSSAGAIWLEFINFLANFAPSSSSFRLLFQPEPGKEASKRALRLRDLYQRAIQVRVLSTVTNYHLLGSAWPCTT
jgi:hypothetical protein